MRFLKVHYRAHNSPPLLCILSQINLVQIAHPISFKTYFKIIYHLRLYLSGGTPSGFPIIILDVFTWFPISFIVTCYLLTRRIIRGLRISYLDFLDITSGGVYNHL
jgi:hypothetical protein